MVGNVVDVVGMVEIVELCLSLIGGGVDGNGYIKFDVFGVVREVGGVGCGLFNYEWM